MNPAALESACPHCDTLNRGTELARHSGALGTDAIVRWARAQVAAAAH